MNCSSALLLSKSQSSMSEIKKVMAEIVVARKRNHFLLKFAGKQARTAEPAIGKNNKNNNICINFLNDDMDDHRMKRMKVTQ